MKIYHKKSKKNRKSKDFYFGDYGEIPIGISCATININNKNNDKLHYHKKGTEFYMTISGSGLLEVEKNDIKLEKNKLVMVEPGEKHKIKSVIMKPFSFIAISTIKDIKDKIIVES